jgi:hypothetical protein
MEAVDDLRPRDRLTNGDPDPRPHSGKRWGPGEISGVTSWPIGKPPWLWTTRIRILFVMDGRIRVTSYPEAFGLGLVVDTMRNLNFPTWWVRFEVTLAHRDSPSTKADLWYRDETSEEFVNQFGNSECRRIAASHRSTTGAFEHGHDLAVKILDPVHPNTSRDVRPDQPTRPLKSASRRLTVQAKSEIYTGSSRRLDDSERSARSQERRVAAGMSRRARRVHGEAAAIRATAAATMDPTVVPTAVADPARRSSGPGTRRHRMTTASPFVPLASLPSRVRIPASTKLAALDSATSVATSTAAASESRFSISTMTLIVPPGW